MFVALALIISLYGCNVTSTPNADGNKNAKASYEKIKLNLDLQEDESITCCYGTDSTMVFSVGKRNGAGVGPLVNAEYLVLYNYVNNPKSERFNMNTEAYIYNAIPYKDGILYATYDNTYESKTLWTVNYIDQKGIKEIDRGYSRDYENMPSFAEINGNPVYLYENIDQNGYRCGVKKVKGMAVDNIFEDVGDYKLCTSGGLPSKW